MGLAESLDPATFLAAWRRVKRSPGAGIDGVNADRFALDLEGNLARLRQAMLRGTYRPDRLLRREIPKEDGVRRLGIPTVADRLAQSAVLEVAGPRLDPLLFPQVHGYRPGSSPSSALAHLCHQIGARPWLELVHADITGLFDNLPHPLLRAAIDAAWADPLWRSLCRLWLDIWAESPGRGVPQGAQLSPLFANLGMARAIDGAIDAACAIPHGRPTAIRAELPWERLSAAGLRVPSRPRAPRVPQLRFASPGGPPLIAWIRYGDDLVLATDTRGGGLRLLTWLDGLVRAAGMALSPHKTVMACGGLAARPLPRPVLGVPMALRPQNGAWILTRIDGVHLADVLESL